MKVIEAQLLIVPYGIETNLLRSLLPLRKLLIVPYGIETMSNFLNKETLQILLIVPYGIETYSSFIFQ